MSQILRTLRAQKCSVCAPKMPYTDLQRPTRTCIRALGNKENRLNTMTYSWPTTVFVMMGSRVRITQAAPAFFPSKTNA